MIQILGKQNSLMSEFICELRDESIQKDSMRFRTNMIRCGEIFAYEISKTLNYKQIEVTTPLGISSGMVLSDQPVLATILRAGLPMHQGMLNYFDKANNAFVSAYRKHHKDGRFTIQVEYISCPDLENKTLIICDPMLATGSSLLLTYKELLQFGQPAHIHVVTLIASTQGVDYLRKNMNPRKTSFWAGAVDEELTAQAYIVPGLGDAGDLAFGSKS